MFAQRLTGRPLLVAIGPGGRPAAAEAGRLPNGVRAALASLPEGPVIHLELLGRGRALAADLVDPAPFPQRFRRLRGLLAGRGPAVAAAEPVLVTSADELAVACRFAAAAGATRVGVRFGRGGYVHGPDPYCRWAEPFRRGTFAVVDYKPCRLRPCGWRLVCEHGADDFEAFAPDDWDGHRAAAAVGTAARVLYARGRAPQFAAVDPGWHFREEP